MPATIEDVLPSAKEVMKEIAIAEAEKASLSAQKHAEEEAEKRALIEQMSKPSGITDEEAIQRGVSIIRRAASAGRTEVQVYRFPNDLCTDRGRAINQSEPGWENTLTGIPKEIYQLWYKYFKPQGYRLKVHIVDFPGGLPGDIAMTLSWG